MFWELCTVVSLARLRMTEGRPDEVSQVLAPVYDRFTEGFDTPFLRAARTLLDEQSALPVLPATTEWVNCHRSAKVNVAPFPDRSLNPVCTVSSSQQETSTLQQSQLSQRNG